MGRRLELSISKRREAVLALLRREEPGAQRRTSGSVPADVHRDATATEIPRWQAWARAAKARLEKLLDEAA